MLFFKKLLKKLYQLYLTIFENYLELNRRCEKCRFYVPFEGDMISDRNLYDFHCGIEQDLYIRYTSEEAFGNFEWEKQIKDWGWFLAANCDDYKRKEDK